MGLERDDRIARIVESLPMLHAGANHAFGTPSTSVLQLNIIERSAALADSVKETILGCNDLEKIITLVHEWMRDQTIVRVYGAGRARLAASIAANRLAHGGAKIFIEGDLVPIPHTIKGGAALAASASGQTASVIASLKHLKVRAPQITVLGIADCNATEFRDLCDFFIGIRLTAKAANSLHALADFGEFVIAEVLDSITVAAGRLGHYDERMWKLGHENVGATGPYDELHATDLTFFEA